MADSKLTGDWISTQEAAEILGVTRRRVLAMIQEGLLVEVRSTGVDRRKTWYLSRREVEELSKKERKPGRPKG